MWLIVRSGTSVGTNIEVTKGLVLGRDPECDLALADDPKVSRRHAFVTLASDDSVTLQDLGSTNGTFVNGQRISDIVLLAGTERLRFGDTEVEVSQTPPGEGSDPRVGETFGRYLIKRFIAEGSMGIVYEAEHLRTGRRVALKVLSPRVFDSPRSRERFLQEARAAGGLEHPNIIPIFDADEVDGVPYLAMRLVRGQDLNTILLREGQLRPDRAVAIVAQIGSALDAAHVAGLIHRDVKPGNILVTSSADTDGADHAYLADFGITKDLAADRGMTLPGHVVGTRDYMAPEQFTGGDVDARTDVYALGCVLFEALTGVRPYPADSEIAIMRAHLETPPPSPHRIRPEVPAPFDAVTAHALAKRQEDRYATCADMVSDAEAALDSTTPTLGDGTPTSS